MRTADVFVRDPLGATLSEIQPATGAIRSAGKEPLGARPHPRSASVPVMLLAALAMLSTAAMDMIVPILGTLRTSLHGSVAHIGWAISMFPAGSAVAQLVCGPLSDRFGRRPLLLLGCAVYTLATFACGLAGGLMELLVCRFLVGAGAGTCLAITFAVVRDSTEPRQIPLTISRITAAMWALSIVAAPLASALLRWAGWRSVFLATAAAGSMVLAAIFMTLRETLAPTERIRPSLYGVWGDYRQIILSRAFRTNALIGALGFSVLFTIGVGAGSLLHVAPESLGLSYGCVVAGLFSGSCLSGAALRRGLTRERLLRSAVLLMFSASLALLLVTACKSLGYLDPVFVVSMLTLMTLGIGAATPCSIAGAVIAFADRSGTAACVMGIARMAISAGISAVVVWVGASDPVVVCMAMSICAGFALVASVVCDLP